MSSFRAAASLLAALLLPTSGPCLADDGFKMLFKSVSASVSEADQKAIYSLMELSLAKDGSGFVLVEGCPPVDFDIELKDMNGDHIPEVFLIGGNTCTSGGTGESVWMFVKARGGSYRMNFGFPSAGYEVLPKKKSMGHPNIRFGGPGFCEAEWRWNGHQYVHFRNVATSPGGCNDG